MGCVTRVHALPASEFLDPLQLSSALLPMFRIASPSDVCLVNCEGTLKNRKYVTANILGTL